MRIYQLDADYALSRRKTWPKAFKFATIIIGVLWTVFIIDNSLFSIFSPYTHLNDFGIYPRKMAGLSGIITTVFLHGSLSHIISNTLPLLLAITALFGNYPRTAKKVFILSIFFTGLLVWMFARSANHIGASGLLYCLLSYVFFSGFIRKDLQSIGISLAIAFLYGSLIFGIIPDKEYISWESHLFGFLSGIFLAWIYRKKDTPVYRSWDEEE